MKDKPYPGDVKLIVLDLDGTLYPYDGAFKKASLRAAKDIYREHGLPILLEKSARRLEKAHGLERGSVEGLLRAKLGRKGGDEPPYRDILARAYALKKEAKAKKAAGEPYVHKKERRAFTEEWIMRIFHDAIGTGFIEPDPDIRDWLRELKGAGMELAILTHSDRKWAGEVAERMDIADLIPKEHIFGLADVGYAKKGKKPDAFEHLLRSVNSARDSRHQIAPAQTVMIEDSIENLEGAKAAELHTVWIPRKQSHFTHPSNEERRYLKWVDNVHKTVPQALSAIHRAQVLARSPEGFTATHVLDRVNAQGKSAKR